MLHLADGTPLPFMLDTGCYYSVLDTSLEPKLGKRFKTQTAEYGWIGKRTNGVYQSPGLYLGRAKLKLDRWIWTDNVKRRADCVPPLMGILGMDCLQHYCIQLDFKEGKIRFLNPDRLETNVLGESFQIFVKNDGVFVRENLFGMKGAKTIVDLADYGDGALNGQLFEREIDQKKGLLWESHWTDPSGRKVREAGFAQGAFGAASYTNLILMDCSNSSDPTMNVLALRFLARHLVTLNFPKQVMYLKQTSVGPLVDENLEAGMRFLDTLKESGRLSGWAKEDKMQNGQAHYVAGFFAGVFPLSITFDIQKVGDASTYHYTIGCTSKESAWTLQKAWRTDEKNNSGQQYPIL